MVKMQHEMLQKAVAERDANLVRVTKWEDFVPALAKGKLCLTPFCDETEVCYSSLCSDRVRQAYP